MRFPRVGSFFHSIVDTRFFCSFPGRFARESFFGGAFGFYSICMKHLCIQSVNKLAPSLLFLTKSFLGAL